MGKKQLYALVICLVAVSLSSVAFGAGVVAEESRFDYNRWIGLDLYLQGQKVVSADMGVKGSGDHILLFEGRFLMSIGADRFSSDKAVVWLKENRTEFRGRTRTDYQAKVYLQGNVSAKKGKRAKISGLRANILEEGRSMVVRFDVSGEVFVTAEQREAGDPREFEPYRQALASGDFAGLNFEVGPLLTSSPADVGSGMPKRTGGADGAIEVSEPEKKEPDFQYPINIRPAGEAALKIESTRTAEGEDVITVLGRFYLWQVQDEEGGLLEFQADNAVIWYFEEAVTRERGAEPGRAIRENIKAIYVSGDVVCTYGQRTIRAEEMFYDFEQNKALAKKAVMRSFDVNRGIPIYVRAAELRQTAINQFAGEEITLTSSEFYLPQISLSASRVIITDTTSVDERTGKLGDSSYDAQMHDVRFKVGNRTFFYWPFVRSNLQRPDVPIKSIRVGHDNVWGTSVETRWYLSRLLGLREEEGTDSTLAVDYYSERGLGTGAEIEYEKEDYYGRLLGYFIDDHGEDRLGRQRRDLEPPRELRGRFRWQHRQFLPHSWQLTSEVSYASDENFIHRRILSK